VRIALVDYGVGNLHSLAKALAGGRVHVEFTRDWDDALGRTPSSCPASARSRPPWRRCPPTPPRSGTRSRAASPAWVLCTGGEGRLEGIDLRAMAAVTAASEHPVWVSGGITSLDDLNALEQVGAAGAVLGMALYTARLDARAVARRWGVRKRRMRNGRARPARSGKSPKRRSAGLGRHQAG
jgi:hypothetical protein